MLFGASNYGLTVLRSCRAVMAAPQIKRKAIPPPTPAYLPKTGSPLVVDHDAYATIQASPRVLVEEFTLPIRSGRAWTAPAGSIVRISTPEGPQVGVSNCSRYSCHRADIHKAISMFGTCTILGSAFGHLAPNNCMPPICPPTTVCGLVCRI